MFFFNLEEKKARKRPKNAVFSSKIEQIVFKGVLG